jgi:MOSC domain-containing protein YiiM
MVLVSIQVGAARDYAPVEATTGLGPLGLEGKTQVNRRHHGGAHRALLAYSAENCARWRQDPGLPQFPFGAFGENLTVTGLDETPVCVGDIYRMGSVRVEVS